MTILSTRYPGASGSGTGLHPKHCTTPRDYYLQ